MDSRRDRLFSLRMRAEKNGRHISGAEGIYAEKEIPEKAREFAGRALAHSKGRSEKITINIEWLQMKPALISSLPLYTFGIRSTGDAWKKAEALMAAMGISGKAFESARKVILKGAMRGASIIGCKKGIRLEPDRVRGIRATRFGIKKNSDKTLTRLLNEAGLVHPRIKEALLLASKVANAPNVIAELCVSDDPGYTTGYVASKEMGYLRLPCMKKDGSLEGGRVFFVEEDADINLLIRYLEEIPVLIGKIAPLNGIISIHETETPCRTHRKPGRKKSFGKKA